MRIRGPHYLLFTGAVNPAGREAQWRFVLQPVGSESTLAVCDVEEVARPSRLELLAVVRGLEALEQPSRVSLLTDSRYVYRGIRRGLAQWRERRWRWERFGRLVPIRDADLWRRVDRAMQFHRVDCSEWHIAEDAPYSESLDDERFGQSGRDFSDTNQFFASDLGEPAVVIVSRAASKQVRANQADLSWLSAMDRLRQAVWAQTAGVRGPEFTQAA